jgi:hypothetical protein
MTRGPPKKGSPRGDEQVTPTGVNSCFKHTNQISVLRLMATIKRHSSPQAATHAHFPERNGAYFLDAP